MPENEPSLGKPIYDEPPTPDGPPSQSDDNQPREGEHVVITPQTAGSAGAAHTQES